MLVQSLKWEKPPGWGPIAFSEEVEMIPLNKSNVNFKYVRSLMGTTITPVEIYRVQNPYLWGCYQLKKEEWESRSSHVREIELWHATDEDNVFSIVESNFDWRRTKRNKFGKGVSFSDDPNYANKYCNKRCGVDRALILCKVIVGKICPGYPSMVIPTKADTSGGNNGRVYVKYGDNEYYPQYVAYYRGVV